MPRVLSVLAILVASGVAAAADAPKVVNRWALLIGIDDYAYAQKLQYCGADQRALAEQLIASGFPSDQVFVLHDQAESARLQPSLGNIERQLTLVLSLADADDLVVVSFSGHGVHLDGKSFLCPKESTLDDPKTLISVDDIYDRLQQCAAGFKLVLVDACRNDPKPGGARSMSATDGTRALARTFEELKPPEGVVLLNSCAPGEISWEEEQFGHGVFMHYVLDGLRGAADAGGDGNVSLNELQAYAGQRTRAYVANRHSVAQRPFLRGDMTTEALEFALLRVAAEKKLLSPEPEVIGAAGLPPNSLGMQFALIPAGDFLMGSPATDASAEADERPQQRVRITRPFQLGRHEVTRAQFARFTAATGYRTDGERDGKGGYSADRNGQWSQRPENTWRTPGLPQQDDHPVVQVTWNDAVAFCNWLGNQEGRRYRLPTEAEWEYACRAGTTTRYVHGDHPDGLTAIGNVADRSFKAALPLGFNWGVDTDDGYIFTAPVGRFKANAFGVYDMTGNVWEWCDDWWGQAYDGTATRRDPAGPDIGDYRIVRGGSWDYPPATARSADRSNGAPDYRSHFIGFRVVRVP